MRYAKSIAALVAAIGVVAATLAAGGPVTLADGLAIASAIAGLLGVYAVPNKPSAPAPVPPVEPAVGPSTSSGVSSSAPPAVPVPVEPPPSAPPVLPAGLVDPVLGDHVARHERIDPNGPSQA